jgi:hypothetical protein
MRTIEIDCLRLSGLELTPEGAERMRGLVEAELQRLLERGRWPEDLVGGEVSRLDAPTIRVNRPDSDGDLANGLAHSIARTLRDVG